MRRLFQAFLIFCLAYQPLFAQKDIPKWVDKAKRAVFTVITYDKDNNILHTGNGFFISDDGIACSDYSLFVGAEKAVVINFEEKQLAVKAIMGVDDMYDVIKFQVEIDKKVAPLQIASRASSKDEAVYLLPYSTKKENMAISGTVEEASPISGGYNYYTLKLAYSDKNVSCPVLSANGEVIGLLQKNTSDELSQAYAVDAAFVKNLSLNALSLNNSILNKIGIRKALPDTEEQALVSLFLRSGNLSNEEYLELLNEFLTQYPNSSEGYLRRASHYVFNFKDAQSFAKAEEDIKKAEKSAESKDNVYYNFAKLIYSNQIDQSGFTYKDWNYEKALTENGKALAMDSLPVYIQQRADIYFAIQDYANAYVHYEKVNHSNLVSPASYYSTAKAKELLNADKGEVIALLDSAVALFPTPLPLDAAPYLLERAQMKMDKGMYREAVTDYDSYYDIVNGQVNDLFYYYREQANYHGKDFKRALEDIQKAIELKPQDVTYLAELGAVNLRIARYEDAIQNLQDALAINPEFAACYRLIGFCQIQLGKKEEACQNLSKAKELGDEAVDILIERNCQ